MKINVSTLKSSNILKGSIALALFASIAFVASAHSRRHGTDILHFFARAPLINEGVVTNAFGEVDVAQDEQGNADHQVVALFARGLDTNTQYTLLAALDDETNLTQVATFTTDRKGRVNLSYRNFGFGRSHHSLPTELQPVSHIREVSIFNSSTQAVLTADFSAPKRLQYLVKRDLSTTNGVDATLRLKSNLQVTQFRLTASGLAASSDYLLALNGGVVQTNSSDASGNLLINSLMENPSDIVNVHSLALWDSTSNIVLSTPLP